MKPQKPDWRKWFSPENVPGWLDPKLVILLVLVALFLVAMAWSEPSANAHKISSLAKLDIPMQITPPAQEPQATPEKTSTPLPLEWQTNREMANGLVLGSIILVLIIVGGTLFAIRRKG